MIIASQMGNLGGSRPLQEVHDLPPMKVTTLQAVCQERWSAGKPRSQALATSMKLFIRHRLIPEPPIYRLEIAHWHGIRLFTAIFH
jgi:hypothetical protein